MPCGYGIGPDPSRIHAVVKDGRLAVDRVGAPAPAGLPDLT
ncbi:hypothetical protein [Streptomyces hydrogenans]